MRVGTDRRRWHVGYREAVALLTFYVGSKTFTSCPAQLIYLQSTSAWIAALVSAVPALLGAGAIALFVTRFRGLSFQHCLEATCGKAAGKILGLMFLLFLVVLDAVSLREFSGAYKTSILPLTPLDVIGWLGVFTSGLGAMFGLESLGRVASLTFVPVLALTSWTILSSIRFEFSIAEVFPLWGVGAAHTILGSISCSSLYSEAFLVGLLLPHTRMDAAHTARASTLPVLYSACGLSATILVLEAVFTAPAAAQMLYPVLQLARAVQFGAFAERAEAPFVFAWFFYASLRAALGNLLSAVLLADILGIKRWSALVWPLAAARYYLAFLPETLVDVFILQVTVFRSVGWLIAFVLPLALLALATVRRVPRVRQ